MDQRRRLVLASTSRYRKELLGRLGLAFETAAPGVDEQPLPGDRVSTLLRIRGTANVFEARFAIDVVKATGGRLEHRAVSASAGTGTRGTFDVTMPLGTAPGRVVVVAYVNSPKDGARST